MSNLIDENIVLNNDTTNSLIEIIPLHRGDERQLYHWMCSQKEHIMRWNPRVPINYFSEYFWQKKAILSLNDWKKDLAYRFLLLQNDQIIGRASLFQISKTSPKEATLSYSISQELQGRGLMKSSLDILLNFVFEKTLIDQIQAFIHPANERSKYLAIKLGFKLNENETAPKQIGDRWYEHQIFIRNRKDYQIP